MEEILKANNAEEEEDKSSIRRRWDRKTPLTFTELVYAYLLFCEEGLYWSPTICGHVLFIEYEILG